MEFNGGKVGHPKQAGQVVHAAIGDSLGSIAGRHLYGPDPCRVPAGTVLLEEERCSRPVWIALEGEGAAGKMREDPGGDRREVVDAFALGKDGLGVEDLVGVGDLYPLAACVDFIGLANGL